MNERDLFIAAQQLANAAQREAFLAEACGANTDLRAQVEELLREHEGLGSFLEAPAMQLAAAEVGGATNAGATQGETCGDDPNPALEFLAPSHKPDSLGRLGHYEIQEVIGRGGMGIVLRAFDDKLHRVVAIKVMAVPLATNATARKRFTREAQAAAAVSHDHIVTIHAVEDAFLPSPLGGEGLGVRGLPYLVMQYIDGMSLQERLDRDGPLQLEEILRIGMQTASGLAAAHAQGLIHRDIKPANILLENGVERVKITDFGLARAAADASLTQSGVIAGTPQYMSPEQASAEHVDHRSDLFSLGSVLYAMCTSQPPFRAETGMAVLKGVCEQTPRPIRESNPEIPDWLVAIIDKLHAKDPGQRYQSAAEVAEVLSRHLAHVQHPSVVGPVVGQVANLPPDSKAGWKPAPRRRRWAVAAALFLCLLAGLSLTEATGVTNLRATVIRVLTPDGTLVVEVDDPGVKVTIEGDGGIVITGAGPQEVRLRPGSYKVQAAKDGKPVPVERELVSIAKGGREIVRVKLESPPAQAAKGATAPPTFKNSLGMEFALVPKGKAWLGGGGGKSGDQEVEIAHDFYMGVYELTQEEWEMVMDKNPSVFSRTGAYKNAVKEIPDVDLKRFPVDQVSWDNCQEFVTRLNEKLKESGWVYRLPMEAEWENACRGGPLPKKEDYGFNFYADGPTNTLLSDRANFDQTGLKRTGKVGSYPPNRLGLYDMHGNVAEWCDDTVGKGASRRVLRGGGWDFPSEFCKTASRNLCPPSYLRINNGLRLARVPVGKPVDPERTAAEWVLDIGGQVDLEIADGLTQHGISQRSNLPLRAFRLRGIFLQNNNKVDDGGLLHLKGLTRLENLVLGQTAVSDAGLEHLKGLRGLKFLNLAYTRVSGTGLEHLKGLAGLKYLWLNGSAVSTGLEHFKGLRLEFLGLAGTRISDAALAQLRGMTSLRNLELAFAPGVSDAGLEHLSGLTGLQSLSLLGTRVSGAGMEHLKGLTGLQYLGLTDSAVSDAGLAHLTGLKELNSLSVDGTKITNAGLEHLKAMEGLHSLNLGKTRVSDAGLENLKGLTGLQSLNLANTKVTGPGLGHLKALTNLENLWLGSTAVTDAGLEQLKAVRKLRSLVLDRTAVTDAGLKLVQGMKNLQYLSLKQTDVTDAGLEHLKGVTQLGSLILTETRVSDAGVQRLQAALPKCQIVR